MGFIIGALKVIVLLGSLILIHEFGHFIVAKFFKMKVLKFSIGFGPKLIHKQTKETEYSLRSIPLRRICSIRGWRRGFKRSKFFHEKTSLAKSFSFTSWSLYELSSCDYSVCFYFYEPKLLRYYYVSWWLSKP